MADHSQSSALETHTLVCTIMTPLTRPSTPGLFTEPVVSHAHDSVPATQQNPLMWSVSARSLYTTPLVNQLLFQGTMSSVVAPGGKYHTQV